MQLEVTIRIDISEDSDITGSDHQLPADVLDHFNQMLYDQTDFKVEEIVVEEIR